MSDLQGQMGSAGIHWVGHYPVDGKDHLLLADENFPPWNTTNVATRRFSVYFRQIYFTVSFMLVGECLKTSDREESNRRPVLINQS